MAKAREKLKALAMRREGMSIKAIARRLKVSTGSVSLWCQSVELTTAQKERLHLAQIKAGHKGRMLGAEHNRQKRLRAIATAEQWGVEKIDTLTRRDRYLLGVGLYWGEGVKSRSGRTSIVNSDPAAILFSMMWLRECLGVKKEDFNPYIYISEVHASRGKVIIRFWGKLLSLPMSRFKLIVLKGRPKKVYENHNLYYGVCALQVLKSTNLKYRILGLIKACKENTGVAQLVGAQHS